MTARKHRHQMPRPYQSGRLQERVFRVGLECTEHRAQALGALLQGHYRDHVFGVAGDNCGRGEANGPGRSAATTGQCGGKSDLRNAEHLHDAGGVHGIEIAGLGAAVIGEAIDIAYRQTGIGAGAENCFADHLVDGARPGLAAHVIRRCTDTDNGGLVAMFPGHSHSPSRHSSAGRMNVMDE
ncbi:hypothetical protein D9M71_524500 [compost metagenome]